MEDNLAKKARLQLEIPCSVLKETEINTGSIVQLSNLRNTTIREPTSENAQARASGSDETKVRIIEVEFIGVDKHYPLIWHIKEMVYK